MRKLAGRLDWLPAGPMAGWWSGTRTAADIAAGQDRLRREPGHAETAGLWSR